MLLSLNIVVVVEIVGSQHLLHFLVWARCDLVDHRPWEGYFFLILQVIEEGCGNKSVGNPTLGIGEDSSLHLVTIVRTVVHRLNGERQLSGIETLKQQGADLTHGKDRLQAAGQIGFVIAVAFLGDSERNHLQTWVLKYLHESVPVLKLWIGLQGFGY